jgi:hypothetical protein
MTSLQIVRTPRTDAEARLVALVSAGVPLSLLLDLSCPDPHSAELYVEETASLDWLLPQVS